MVLEGMGDTEARARGLVRRARARAAAAGAAQPKSSRRRVGGSGGFGGALAGVAVERPVRRQLPFIGSRAAHDALGRR